MQKHGVGLFLRSLKILKSRVAFVAFVARSLKSSNALKLGVIFWLQMATIYNSLKSYLLLLLPATSYTGYVGYKMSDPGYKLKALCSRIPTKKDAIAANGGLKQQWQQKQHSFSTLFFGVSTFGNTPR